MGSVNKVILVGNLGRDAELKFSPSGFPISSFSLATTDRRKDKDDQWSEKTEWHRIKLLGKQAESLKDYLKKGKQIYVEGRIETRSWDDKDGQKRYMTEIVADRIQLLGSGGGGGGARPRRRRLRHRPLRFGAGTVSGNPGRRHPVLSDERRATSWEFRVTNDECWTAANGRVVPVAAHFTSLIRHSFTRHSSFVIRHLSLVPSRPYRSSSRTTSSSSGVETSKMSQSSMAVIRCTVGGGTWMRSPGFISRLTSSLPSWISNSSRPACR